jgi:hypothetical protein
MQVKTCIEPTGHRIVVRAGTDEVAAMSLFVGVDGELTFEGGHAQSEDGLKALCEALMVYWNDNR